MLKILTSAPLGSQAPGDAAGELIAVDVLAQAYESTMRGGTTIAIGLPHPDHQFSIPAVTLSAMEKTVKGSYQGSCVPGIPVIGFRGDSEN